MNFHCAFIYIASGMDPEDVDGRTLSGTRLQVEDVFVGFVELVIIESIM